MATTWLPVPGWEGLYEVSSDGEVRSLARTVLTRKGYGLPKPGVVLKGRVHKGYRSVNLAGHGRITLRPVHRIVAEAFIGPLPVGLQTRHLDGDSLNNAAANLAYGTAKENAEDKRRHGTLPQRQTHCARGHALDESNTYVRPSTGQRACRTCRRRLRQPTGAVAA